MGQDRTQGRGLSGSFENIYGSIESIFVGVGIAKHDETSVRHEREVLRQAEERLDESLDGEEGR